MNYINRALSQRLNDAKVPTRNEKLDEGVHLYSPRVANTIDQAFI